MKKMMKKIKSNSFISKTIAILTICMVLMSSLSVSVFAADDEVSAANEESESITDVWTLVMNWITSSLSSAQGAFVNSTDPLIIEYGVPISTSVGIDLIPILNFPDVNVGDSFDVTISIMDQSADVTLSIFDSSYNAGVTGLTYSMVAVGFIGNEQQVLAFYNPYTAGSTYPFDGWYSYDEFGMSFASGIELTFLGTLAVIGVAIAIAFLFISVISRFLRLRG